MGYPVGISGHASANEIFLLCWARGWHEGSGVRLKLLHDCFAPGLQNRGMLLGVSRWAYIAGSFGLSITLKGEDLVAAASWTPSQVI